ncbi:uncharacterized protein LOC134660332 [Cydia amplana]|uniref:uncharacterized protein LOC134660332 n=1 Tax=Cydia amplana TaxID=1869771 RepID=UPI002FE5385B
MNCIKTESDDLICRGCLSTDRRLSPLANYDMFLSLLVEKQRTEALSKPYILICWECNATLRRFQLFQGQVRRAHTVLEESLTLPPKNTLSCLSIRIKDKYDACFEDTQLLEENPYFKIPSLESIKRETPRNETETDNDVIKVENAISVSNKGLNVPPKNRKIKSKTIEKKKRKVKSEEPLVTTLKVDKSKKKSKKKDKIKHVEIEVCNVNENQADDKVEVKVERVSDVEENHWMQDAFDDEQHVTDNYDSDDSYKDEKQKRECKKRLLTFKKTIIDYSEDVSQYFTEVVMSEGEMRDVLENQVELVNKAKPYRCEFCGLCFKQKKTLTGHVGHSHRKAKHKDQIKKEPDEASDRFFLYRCCYCDRMLRKEHTHSHLHEHHRHKYQCLGCRWSEAFFW